MSQVYCRWNQESEQESKQEDRTDKKLRLSALCTAAALRISTWCKSLSLLISVLIKTLQEWHEAHTLIDSDAEVNFISQQWVKKNNLSDTENQSCEIKTIDDYYVKFYDHWDLETWVMNSEFIIQKTLTCLQNSWNLKLWFYSWLFLTINCQFHHWLSCLNVKSTELFKWSYQWRF